MKDVEKKVKNLPDKLLLVKKQDSKTLKLVVLNNSPVDKQAWKLYRLRRQAAAGLAAGQAAGAFGGGGAGASLRQTAAELGQQQADFGAQQKLLQQQYQQTETARAAELAEKAGEYGAVAAVQGVEAEKFAAEAQSALEDRQRKGIEADTQIAQIKKDHKGESWWKSDDEEGAAAAIQALADAETDPVIKKKYQDEVNRIKKEGNFAF